MRGQTRALLLLLLLPMLALQFFGLV